MELYEMLGISKAEYEHIKQEAREAVRNDTPTSDDFKNDPNRPQEVPEEVWGYKNSLMAFCSGVFEDWELGELQRCLDKIANKPEEEQQFSPEYESILLMQNMLKSHFYKRKK